MASTAQTMSTDLLNARAHQRVSYGNGLRMLKFLGLAAAYQPPDTTNTHLPAHEAAVPITVRQLHQKPATWQLSSRLSLVRPILTYRQWNKRFTGFDTCNVYRGADKLALRLVLDAAPKPPGQRRDPKVFGRALRVLLFYRLNTWVMEAYGWVSVREELPSLPDNFGRQLDNVPTKFTKVSSVPPPVPTSAYLMRRSWPGLEMTGCNGCATGWMS